MSRGSWGRLGRDPDLGTARLSVALEPVSDRCPSGDHWSAQRAGPTTSHARAFGRTFPDTGLMLSERSVWQGSPDQRSGDGHLARTSRQPLVWPATDEADLVSRSYGRADDDKLRHPARRWCTDPTSFAPRRRPLRVFGRPAEQMTRTRADRQARASTPVSVSRQARRRRSRSRPRPAAAPPLRAAAFATARAACRDGTPRFTGSRPWPRPSHSPPSTGPSGSGRRPACRAHP